jgi:hypothetical protein
MGHIALVGTDPPVRAFTVLSVLLSHLKVEVATPRLLDWHHHQKTALYVSGTQVPPDSWNIR